MNIEEINSRRTPKGGWTKKQLLAWGIPWPPPKGWKKTLLDKEPELPMQPPVCIGPIECKCGLPRIPWYHPWYQPGGFMMKGKAERIDRMRKPSDTQDMLNNLPRPNKNSQEFLRYRFFCELETDFGAQRCYDRCAHCKAISKGLTQPLTRSL